MPFCGYCGKEVEDNIKFCKYCGNKLDDENDFSGNTDVSTNSSTPAFLNDPVGYFRHYMKKDHKETMDDRKNHQPNYVDYAPNHPESKTSTASDQSFENTVYNKAVDAILLLVDQNKTLNNQEKIEYSKSFDIVLQYSMLQCALNDGHLDIQEIKLVADISRYRDFCSYIQEINGIGYSWQMLLDLGESRLAELLQSLDQDISLRAQSIERLFLDCQNISVVQKQLEEFKLNVYTLLVSLAKADGNYSESEISSHCAIMDMIGETRNKLAELVVGAGTRGKNTIVKCPQCGEAMPPYVKVCPTCKFVFTTIENHEYLSGIQLKLQAVDHGLFQNADKRNEKRKEIINSLTFPDDPKDLLQLMTYALTCVSDGGETGNEVEMRQAWFRKIQEFYSYSKIVFKNSTVLTDIDHVYHELERKNQTAETFYKKSSTKKKLLILVAAILLIGGLVALILSISHCHDGETKFPDTNEYIGDPYLEVLGALEYAGFSHVTAEPVFQGLLEDDKVGKVATVSFPQTATGKYVKFDVPIVVYYYSSDGMVRMPDLNSYVGKDKEGVLTSLERMGFTSIRVLPYNENEFDPGDVDRVVEILSYTTVQKNSWGSVDVPLYIYYHDGSGKSIVPDLSDLTSGSYMNVKDLLESSGFNNIVLNPISSEECPKDLAEKVESLGTPFELHAGKLVASDTRIMLKYYATEGMISLPNGFVYQNSNYSDVVNALTEIGFSHVTSQKVREVSYLSSGVTGQVVEIKIGERRADLGNYCFSDQSSVIVRYYDPQGDIQWPAEKDIIGLSYTKAAELLKQYGFTSISETLSGTTSASLSTNKDTCRIVSVNYAGTTSVGDDGWHSSSSSVNLSWTPKIVTVPDYSKVEDCFEAESLFKKAGFTNIILNAVPELKIGWLHDEYELINIYINDVKADSKGGDQIAAGSKIFINYYAYENKK